MCDSRDSSEQRGSGRMIPITEAVGMVLSHDITEIRPGEFKGAAFRKGHVIRREDVCHLQRLGKEHLFVLTIGHDEMHEDDAAYALAGALIGPGVALKGEPREGKIDFIADRDGLLKVDEGRLVAFNMLGDVMCATMHTNSIVKKGQTVAGTRAIPLVIKRELIDRAVATALSCGDGLGVVRVAKMKAPRAGVVITGTEVYSGTVKDAFAPVIREKVEALGGEIVDIIYAPDDETLIERGLRELLGRGADLLITTGGMSVDPDDVTRFAIRNLGGSELTYGSAVLPGAMFLVAYIETTGIEGSGLRIREDNRNTGEHDGGQPTPDPLPLNPTVIPVLGIPACGMYGRTTVFDLILPRILAGEKIGRRELAQLGHGGLCLKCPECRYPICPFGK